LVASRLNIPGGNLDGEQSVLSIRMADKFNNPVPDGTVAFFTTEFASIEPSCETFEGGCTVTLTSQEPRQQLFNTGFIKRTDAVACPSHGAMQPCPVSLGNIFGGRSTILATAIGEESFIDANGNGLYDDGELFEDLGEAFLDHNEDGIYNPAGVACTPPAVLRRPFSILIPTVCTTAVTASITEPYAQLVLRRLFAVENSSTCGEI
jgi:hypothetical protein